MKNHPRRATLTGCAIALALSLSALAAQAGDVVADASRNLEGFVSNPSPGSSTSAFWPDPQTPTAWAVVDRTHITREAYGAGSATFNQAGAGGHSWTAYTLWDLGTHSALDGGIAATLDLSFNYRIQGLTNVQTVGTSVASANYLVELYSSAYHADGAGLTVVYGPVPPFPSEDYLFTGDTRLAGAYDWTFSVLHENASGGLMWMAYSGTAANAATITGTLSLQTITLASGVMPTGGLGVRLETGEIITVSAVPEPATWLLWAGAGLLAALRKSRRSA